MSLEYGSALCASNATGAAGLVSGYIIFPKNYVSMRGKKCHPGTEIISG
jgi:hypothetical protein